MLKRLGIITFGLIVMAIGLHWFLFPANLASGGLSGFALLLNAVVPSISIGLVMLIGNIILFVLAFIMIGREFGGYTIYSSLMLSAMIGLLERVWPITTPPVDDILLNLVFGTLIPAIGMGVIFYQNSSTGGTDILAKILTKKTTLDIGKALLCIDFFIVLGAISVFGLRLGLYALLGVIMNAFVIDYVITGFHSRIYLTIISDAWEPINHYIIEEINRGTTLYIAEGGFQQTPKKVIHTITSKREYIDIRRFIKRTDPSALVSIHFEHEVFGEGFHYMED